MSSLYVGKWRQRAFLTFSVFDELYMEIIIINKGPLLPSLLISLFPFSIFFPFFSFSILLSYDFLTFSLFLFFHFYLFSFLLLSFSILHSLILHSPAFFLLILFLFSSKFQTNAEYVHLFLIFYDPTIISNYLFKTPPFP